MSQASEHENQSAATPNDEQSIEATPPGSSHDTAAPQLAVDENCSASSSSCASDDDEDESKRIVVRWFLVEVDKKPAERVPSSDYVDNVGLRKVMDALNDAESPGADGEEDVKKKRWRRCDCQFPHDILACDLLHSRDETLRIGKDFVRIAGALPNVALETLLRVPKGRHAWCTLKKAHDPLACKFLHRHPQAVPIGRERLGYLPEELVDNGAYRHLLTHPEHNGKWCSNVLKHEAKTCLFMHRAAKGGQALGKRNLNVAKDGRMIKSATAFERKKRSGRVLASADTEVPEFIRKQRELDELVNRINDESADAAEEDVVEQQELLSSSPQLDEASLAASHQSSGGKRRASKGLLADLRKVHPALLAMIGAFVLAMLVQLLPN